MQPVLTAAEQSAINEMKHAVREIDKLPPETSSTELGAAVRCTETTSLCLAAAFEKAGLEQERTRPDEWGRMVSNAIAMRWEVEEEKRPNQTRRGTLVIV